MPALMPWSHVGRLWMGDSISGGENPSENGDPIFFLNFEILTIFWNQFTFRGNMCLFPVSSDLNHGFGGY